MAGSRVAQHYVQVVGRNDPSGELRVSRLYAEVLVSDVGAGGTTHNRTVNDTLNLSDTAGIEKDVTANNTINVTQNAVGTLDRQGASDTLNLTDNLTYVTVFNREETHNVNLSDIVARVKAGVATSNLDLTQNIVEFNYVADRSPAGSTLNLVQTVTTLSSLEVTQDLGLSQTVNVKAPYKPFISHLLSLQQTLPTPHRVWVEDEIDFRFVANVPYELDCNSTLNLTDTLPDPRTSPESTINFSQTALGAKWYDLSHNTALTDEVDVTSNFIRSVSDEDFIGHSLTWWEDTRCGRKQYTPFQGENTIPSSSNFTPPSPTLQDPQGDTGNFSLYVPYLGVPTSKVTLRKPELDNRDRNAYTRINDETRGGKLVVFSDPDWPHVRTLAVTIIGLLESEVDELQTFMQATLGQEIGLTDWEGRLWKGVIINPNEVATQDGRAMWTVTFEFEGEMLNVEQPESNDGEGQQLDLTQSVTAVIV